MAPRKAHRKDEEVKDDSGGRVWPHDATASAWPTQVARASELYGEGLSLPRVAGKLGVSRGGVNNDLRVAGVQLRRRR